MKNFIDKIKKIEFTQVLVVQLVILLLGIGFFLSTNSGNGILQDIGIVRPQETDQQARIEQTYKEEKLKDFAENPEDYYYVQDGKTYIQDDILTIEDIKKIDAENDNINFDYNNLEITRPGFILRDERAKEAAQEDENGIPHDLDF